MNEIKLLIGLLEEQITGSLLDSSPLENCSWTTGNKPQPV